MRRFLICGMVCVAAFCTMLACGGPVLGQTFPLPLTNHKSGISVSLSGSNGVNWAVEMSYHDEEIADQTLYVTSSVSFSLAHNANNTIEAEATDWAVKNHVLGTQVPPGAPNGGEIRYKIDRDQQAGLSGMYCGDSNSFPAYEVAYSAPFNFATLTYDGTMRVLGKTGNNGGAYGISAWYTSSRYWYGMNDGVGNEWHVLTYWDNDVPLLTYENSCKWRALGSDGYCVPICVNPQTPIIQLSASGADQFYTTPVKTYFIPKIWDRTTYMTSGVRISFVNLTNSASVLYQADGGSWQTWNGTALAASALFSGSNTTHALQVKCGASGTVLTRAVVYQPAYPAPTEQHGYLLWANEADRQAVIHKLNNVQPFQISYQQHFAGRPGLPVTFNTDQRQASSFWAYEAQAILQQAFISVVDGPTSRNGSVCASAAKLGLLWLSRLEPVGFELHICASTPAKDYLSELGQSEECFADAAVGYDLLAGFYRSSQQAGGLTPIEEVQIRDGLAKIAKSLLQFRDNYGAVGGGGDSHWSLGYELTMGITSLAMPSYATSYYGVSGGDFQTVNNLSDSSGHYWNPFPTQGLTWHDAACNPWVATPGYPNNVASCRTMCLYTDDGWWCGPNDLYGAPALGTESDDYGRYGDVLSRYVRGPLGERLVDVLYGNMANAECRVELIDMDGGYESPFTERLAVFDFMRRIKGDPIAQASGVTNYIQRHMVNGYQTIVWNSTSSAGTSGYGSFLPRRIDPFLCSFNHHYNFASLPSSRNLVGTFLNDLCIYYGVSAGSLSPSQQNLIDRSVRKVLYDPYVLALCESPSTMPAYVPGPVKPPIIAGLFKYVIAPGDPMVKNIWAIEPNGNPLTVTAGGLPAGATWDSTNWSISWAPKTSDIGVQVVTVTASSAAGVTQKPFLIIVMTGASKCNTPGAVPVPEVTPTNFTAALNSGSTAVVLNWTAPRGVTVANYCIYRDLSLWAVTPANVTTYTDSAWLTPSAKPRYDISYIASNGAESLPLGATPANFQIPATSFTRSGR